MNGCQYSHHLPWPFPYLHYSLTISLPIPIFPLSSPHHHSPSYLPLLTLTLTLDILPFSSPSLSHLTSSPSPHLTLTLDILPFFSPSLSHLTSAPSHHHSPTYLLPLLTLTLPLGTLPSSSPSLSHLAPSPPLSRGTRNPLNKVLEAYREVEAYRTMFRLPCDELLDCYTDCLMYAPSSKSNIVGRLFLSRRYLCFGSKVSGGGVWTSVYQG